MTYVSGASVRLHGRDEEIAALTERLERSVAGRGQAAFVEGEAGIGKTALMATVAATAAAMGFAVFRGRGEELEAIRPFGPLADALECERRSPDQARVAISRLISGEGSGEEDEGREKAAGGPMLRFRVVEAFVDLVENLALARPVLLVLEDLHWADPSTLLALHVLGRRLRYTPVMLVGTFRPTPCSRELERLVDTRVAEGGLRLRLGPLHDTAVVRLATESAGGAPGPRLRQRLSSAGGSPLFVLELIDALREEGALQVAGGTAEISQVGVLGDAGEGDSLPTLHVTILQRLNFLSPNALELLRLASVLGSTLSMVDLAKIYCRPVVDLLPAVREALRAGLLGEVGDHLVFRHDLVREAVYYDLPSAVRVALHREAGHALAASGAPARRVATHLALGATPGDTEAVDWLRRAARQALPRDPGVAADLLGRAAELTGPDDLIRDKVVADQVHALLWSGRINEGHVLARQLLDRCQDPTVEVPLRVALGWALAMRGKMRDAAEINEVVTAVDRLGDRERVLLRASAALGRAAAGDAGSAGVATSARTEADRLGDDVAWCAATTALALVAMAKGHLTVALAQVTQVMARAAGNPMAEVYRTLCGYVLVQCLTMTDRVDEAAEAIGQARTASHERGSVWNLPLLHYASGSRGFVTGNWDDAIVEIEAGLALASEVGTPLGAEGAHGMLALLAVHRGQPSAAMAHLQNAERVSTGPGPGTYVTAWARGLRHEAAQRPDQALDCLEQAWAQITDLSAAAEYPRIGPDLVRLALVTEHRERALEVTEAVEAVATRMSAASAEGAALHCRGLADADPAVLLRAVASYHDAPRPFERARVCEDAALALSHQGRHDEARPLFEEALGIYRQLTAVCDTDRVEQAMRAAGIATGNHDARGRPASGWDALTETELWVVDLVAEDLTNAQIGDRLSISHHIVAIHLTHIFAKLRIASRAELIAHAAQHTRASRLSGL